MTSLSQEATIKYRVDSTQAVQATKQLSRAQNVMATGSAPAMTGSLGALGGAVTDLTGANQKLGFSVSSVLGPAFGLFGSALAAVNPIVLAATVAAAALAAVWLASKDDLERLTKALDEHGSNLDIVATSTSEYADEAKRLLDIKKDGLLIRKAELEADLALIQSGKRQAETLDYVKSSVMVFATAMSVTMMPVLTAVGISFDEVREKISDAVDVLGTGLADVDPSEQTEALVETIGALGGVIGQLDKMGESSKSAGSDLLKVRKQILRLNEAIAGDKMSVEKLKEFYDERVSIIEEAAAIEIEKVGENAALRLLIEERTALQLKALFLDYSLARSELEFSYVETVEMSAAQALRVWANTFKQRETLETKALRVQRNFLKLSQKAFAEAEAGRISILQAGAKTAILMAAEEVAGILEKKAVWWAAEAIAAAARYDFPAMALYAAAAAAATGAAVFVRGEAERSFQPENENDRFENEPLAGSPSAEGTRRGTTVVSEGPLTLNYQATQIINGNVFGTEDLFDLWSSWNEDQMRAAAGEARERTRG